MNLVIQVLVTISAFCLGYFVGRAIGHGETMEVLNKIRQQLKEIKESV